MLILMIIHHHCCDWNRAVRKVESTRTRRDVLHDPIVQLVKRSVQVVINNHLVVLALGPLRTPTHF